MWGIGALAMSPDAIPEGPRRKRLVRAATLTSAMGIAWASAAGGAPPSHRAPSFDHIGLPSADDADADDDLMRLSSPLPGPWQRMHDTPPSEPEVAPVSDEQATSPAAQNQKARKREQASEVTAKREARPTEEQGQTKGDAENGKKKAVAKGDAPGKAEKAEKKAGKPAKPEKKPAKAEKRPTTPEKTQRVEKAEKTSGKPDKADRAKGKAKADANAKADAKARAKDDEPKSPRARTAQASRVSAAPDPNAWRTKVFASHEQVEFVQMSDKTVLVGFHEAAMPGAKPLAAASRPDANHGRGNVSFSNVDDPLTTMILPTRARTTNAASAIDVVIPAREAVFSPVTGTVTEVDNYQLYGTYPDNRLVIVPDARPDLRLVMLHVEGVKVRPGDRVVAGQTKLAIGANPFPFESQIDRFARPLMRRKGEATPHVHIELR